MWYFKEIFKYILLIILASSLSGCGADSDCIDPDDFGFTVLDVSARYPEDKLLGTRDDQIAPWIDRNLRLNGKILVITVKNWSSSTALNNRRQLSAWCPWFGSEKYKDTLSPYCSRLVACSYKNDEMCNNPQIDNPPCVMKKGVGLYAYMARQGAVDPNTNQATMVAPTNGVTMHVGKVTTGYSFFDIFTDSTMGGITYDYDGRRGLGSTRANYVNGKLYFKILDTYYKDNSGKYKVVIRSGLKQPGTDIFTKIRILVQERLFGRINPNSTEFEKNGVVRSIYENIVSNPGFVGAVRAALMLYVTITGLLFIIGSINMTNSEIVERVLKISIVSVLISANSWNFFNQYLFIWMYKGSGFIVDMYANAVSSGPGDSSLLAFLTSPQIMAKLSAMLFLNYMGLFYILLYFLMLIFLTFVLFNATLIYMSALIMIGLLIALAPIFIVFYLFESTKSFFENWLKQMIGYAIQIIIISSGILFMSLIIRTQIYNNLGYGVCLKQFPNMGVGSSPLSAMVSGSSVDDGNVTSLFAWWFPHIESNPSASYARDILVPKAFYKTTNAANNAATLQSTTRPSSDFCEPYQCLEKRYPDLPFLDPNDPKEARLMRIQRDGTKVDFHGLFILIVCCYLLYHFNKTTTSIAKFLSSTTGNLGDNTSASGDAFVRVSGALVKYGDNKLGVSRRRKKMEEAVEKKWDSVVVKNVRSYASKVHYNRLERQALRNPAPYTGFSMAGGANNASTDVLKQVSSKYGLSQEDAREYQKNRDQYKQTIENLSHEEIDAKALYKALEKGDLDRFEELSNKYDHKSKAALAAMGQAKAKEMRFKKAYVDSYRDLMEAKKENVSKKSAKLKKRAYKADRNIAAFNNLKRYFSGNLLSSEADEILYNDSNLMTTNERLAQKQERLEAKARKKALNRMTVKAGKDVQRFDYVAQCREDLKHATNVEKAQKEMNRLDNLIKAAVEDNLREALIEGTIEDDVQVGTIKGDAYIRNEMSDSEFKKMIRDVKLRGNEIMLNDDYIDNADLYMGTPGAEDELETRKSHYASAIDNEINRLNDVRYGDPESPSTFGSDFKKWSYGSSGEGNDSNSGGGGTGPAR